MSARQYDAVFRADGSVSVAETGNGGEKQLERTLRRLSELPGANGNRAVRNATAKGARKVRREIKSGAPRGETGNLRRALMMRKERQRKKGKAVYFITYGKAFNKFLQKPVKNPGKYGGKYSGEKPHAYYPSSMEYGFKRSPEMGDFPGYHFMRTAADAISEAAKDATVEDLWRQIEKEWNKLNGA